MSNTAAMPAPDPRAEQIRSDPAAYFRRAREVARKEAVAAERREDKLRRRRRR